MILWRILFYLSLTIVCGSGCALIEVDKRTTYQDINGDPSIALLRKIRTKVTTREWLLAQFDQPLHEHKPTQDQEILTWRFSATKNKTVSALIFFKWRSAKSEQEFLHVALRNDIVYKRWLDKHEYIDVGDYVKKDRKHKSWLSFLNNKKSGDNSSMSKPKLKKTLNPSSTDQAKSMRSTMTKAKPVVDDSPQQKRAILMSPQYDSTEKSSTSMY